MSQLPKPNAGILDIAPYVGGKSKAAPGVKVVKLSSNESPLGPSPKALAAFTESAKYLHRYPDGNSQKLREAISQVHKLPVEQIICGAGSDELIQFLVSAYAGVGDEVLYPEHGFLMYKIYAQSRGATPVTAPEKNLTTDVDALLAAVTERTKIVFVANPNNPTGSYISSSEMARLQKGLPPHVILAIDGAYAEFPEHADYSDGHELVASTENTIMLRTFSKIYGLGGMRIGWAYAPANIIDVLNRVRGPFNVSGAAIETGAAAMLDTEFTAAAIAHNTKWLAWLSAELSALGLTAYPSAGNFLLVGFPSGKAKNASAFLMERGLIVREVANYGLPDCLRITIGLEEDNKAVVATLKDFLAS
ncbi:MAG: histidinol-phosphate transaminase [Alphaproteobacteria bacterium]|nr:histidinol-phosphate transaminase [Alphaproteobacteria bacterium]